MSRVGTYFAVERRADSSFFVPEMRLHDRGQPVEFTAVACQRRRGQTPTVSAANRAPTNATAWWTIDRMWTRWLALAATAWAGAYVVGYLALVHHDGNPAAWWYVGIIVIGMAAAITVAGGWLSRPALVSSAVVLGIAALVGLLSIGILLLPSIACLIVGMVLLKPTPSSVSSPR